MAAARTRTYYQDAPPRSDAYTGLLVLSFIALLIGCVLLYLDYDQYGGKKPTPPQVPAVKVPAAPKGPEAGAGGQAQPGGAQPGGQPGGAQKQP